jgi:hypothetical protein
VKGEEPTPAIQADEAPANPIDSEEAAQAQQDIPQQSIEVRTNGRPTCIIY